MRFGTQDRSPRRFAIGRATLPAALLIAALFAGLPLPGCDRDTVTGLEERGGDETLIHPAAFVITGDDSLILSDIVGTTYIFDLRKGIPDLRRGDYLVGTENGGYLRTVHSADTSAGKLVVETEWAHIPDVLVSGAIDTTIPIGLGSAMAYPDRGTAFQPDAIEMQGEISGPAMTYAAPGVTLSGGKLHLGGVVLHRGQVAGNFVEVTIPDGYIIFNPDCRIGIHTAGGEVEEFGIVAEGVLEFDCDVHVEVADTVDHSKEILLASISATEVQMVGRLPVVEVFELDFYAGYELAGRLVQSCYAGCESTVGITVGAEFSEGAWSSISSDASAFAGHPFSCDDYADGSITVYVKPRISVSIYSVPTAVLEFSPNVGFSAILSKIPVWEWRLFGGIRAGSSFSPSIVSAAMPAFSDTPIDVSEILDTGPFATDAYIYVFSWSGGEEPFEYPRGVATDPGGYVYVADKLNHHILKFTPDSTLVTSWGGLGDEDGNFICPQDIAVDAGGNIYVIDGDNHRIQKFSPDTTFVTAWGSEGSGDREFEDPVGIAADDAGNIYVVDMWTSRVQKFTTGGAFITSWGGFGDGEGEFDGPMGIAVDGGGNVYVAECQNNRVQKFTANGSFVTMWGKYGSVEGSFNCPIAVAVDADGYVYVLDYGNDRVQKFAPFGTFVAALGSSGTGNGQFDHPEGIAVDAGGTIYVSDTRNRRIQKFAPKE